MDEGKRNLEREITQHRHQREEADKFKRDLESQRGDRMKAYGVRMPQVLEAIRRETRWEKRKPVGPFGATLELLKPEFANVLEGVLNTALNAFVVETFRDRDTLVQILIQNQLKNIPVFVSDYDIFDYSSGEPDPQYLTALRALKFNDEWVKRQLITNNKIEKMLLMTDRKAADDLMYNNTPHNIQLCFTDGGYKVGGKQGMKTESVDPYRGAPRFQKDIAKAISYQENKAQEALNLENEKKDAYRRLVRDIKELERQRNECTSSLQSLKREIAGLESTIGQKKETLKILSISTFSTMISKSVRKRSSDTLVSSRSLPILQTKPKKNYRKSKREWKLSWPEKLTDRVSLKNSEPRSARSNNKSR